MNEQPSMGDPRTRLELRSRRVIRADGDAVLDVSVRCPVRGADVALHQCLECDRCEGLSLDRSSGNAEIVCRGDLDATATGSAPPPPAAAEARSASNTPIAEIMARHVVCVRPDLDTRTLATLFLERGISGAPVVDDDARPIGIVSKTDLVREHHERPEGSRPPPPSDLEELSDLGVGFHTEAAPVTTVADIMMPVAFCLPANESIARAAALMAFEGVHRVPVVGSRGQVVGLVSPLDVLRWLARENGFVVGGTR